MTAAAFALAAALLLWVPRADGRRTGLLRSMRPREPDVPDASAARRRLMVAGGAGLAWSRRLIARAAR